MAETTGLRTKLQIRPGTRLRLVNAPDELARVLSDAADVALVDAGAGYDGAIVFCQTPADVDAVAEKVLSGLPPDGLLWFAYRKGTAGKATGLTRDLGWAALTAKGLEPVRSVAIDDAWTGLRFRQTSAIESRKRPT